MEGKIGNKINRYLIDIQLNNGCYVRLIGLEPTRITPPDPKSGAAASYATGAFSNAFAKLFIIFQ